VDGETEVLERPDWVLITGRLSWLKTRYSGYVN